MVLENMQSMHFAHMGPSPDQEVNRWVMVSQSRLMHESKAKQVRTRLLLLQDSPRRWCSHETPHS